MKFSFQKLTVHDLPQLYDWLGIEHVAQWWRESRDYLVFEKKYRALTDDPTVGQYLVYHDAKPIGFISWYAADHCPFRAEQYPEGTYGIDMFIADTDYLGKGYSRTLIQQFLDTILMPLNPKKIIIDPEFSNKRAIHVYKKFGFKPVGLACGTDGTAEVEVFVMEFDLKTG